MYFVYVIISYRFSCRNAENGDTQTFHKTEKPPANTEGHVDIHIIRILFLQQQIPSPPLQSFW